jgi:hypothetical protein
MKGYVYLLEMAIAAMLITIVLVAFFAIRIKQNWERADLIAIGNNILNSIKYDSNYLTEVLNENLTKIDNIKEENINYGLKIIGSPKSNIEVGCINPYCPYVDSLLTDTYVNGRWINFSVNSFDITNGIPDYDAVVLVNFTGYSTYKQNITDYLSKGGVVIGINSTATKPLEQSFSYIFNLTDPPPTKSLYTSFNSEPIYESHKNLKIDFYKFTIFNFSTAILILLSSIWSFLIFYKFKYSLPRVSFSRFAIYLLIITFFIIYQTYFSGYKGITFATTAVSFKSYKPVNETIPKYFLGIGFDVINSWYIWEQNWNIEYLTVPLRVNISRGSEYYVKGKGEIFSLTSPIDSKSYSFKIKEIWYQTRTDIQPLNKTFVFKDFSEGNVRGTGIIVDASDHASMTSNNSAIWISDFPRSDEYRTLVKAAIASRTDKWTAEEVYTDAETTTVSSFASLCCDMPETAELYLTLWYRV